MTTSTDNKQDLAKDTDRTVSPTDDELLAKDLPRPKETSGSHRAVDEPSTDPNRIRPVELERTANSTTDVQTKPVGDATEPYRNTLKPKSGQSPSTKDSSQADTARPAISGASAPGTGVESVPTADRPQNMPMVRQTGQTLRFPTGVNLIPGRTVNVNGVAFEIKPEEAFKGMFWAKSIGIMVVTLLAAIGVAYLLSGPDPGALTGVVINAETGEIVTNATIALGNERSAATSEAGLYIFNDVSPEQYVLTAAAPGFVSQNGYIEIDGTETEQLSFALEPLVSATYAVLPDSADAEEEKAEEEAKAQKQEAAASSAPSYGSVDLDVDFSGYMVFVDGKLYGKNSEELKRLTEGNHRVLLQVEGYEDYTANVTVKARNTATLTVAKADLKPRIDPIKRSRGHFAKGKASIDQKEWMQAIREFDEALHYDPEYAEAMQYRGWVYLKTDNPSLAMADFTRAADLFDDNRRYIDAVACAKYMIEISPKDPDHWKRRGDYNLALADYDQAIDDYERAVKLDKKSLRNRLALAEALYAAGEYKDAGKEFDRARKLADDPTHAYIRMILAYYNAGERDDVVDKYEDFAEVASPEVMQRLREDPEWLKVLQIIGPDERLKN